MSFEKNTVQFFCTKMLKLFGPVFCYERFEFLTIEKPRVPEGSRKVLLGFPEGRREGFEYFYPSEAPNQRISGVPNGLRLLGFVDKTIIRKQPGSFSGRKTHRKGKS